MGIILKNISFFLLFLTLSAFTFNDSKTEEKREKKLNKSIQKIWGESVRLVPVSFSLNDHGFNKFEAIVQGTDTVGIAFSGRVFSCRSGGCMIQSNSDSDKGPSEYFDTSIIYDTRNKIKKVEVYNYKATHGQEVSAKSWLKQFIDYDGGALKYGKDIDALSGATISAENLTGEVERVTSHLQLHSL